MRRLLLGTVRVLSSIVTNIFAVGCVAVILVAVMLVFPWLVLR